MNHLKKMYELFEVSDIEAFNYILKNGFKYENIDRLVYLNELVGWNNDFNEEEFEEYDNLKQDFLTKVIKEFLK